MDNTAPCIEKRTELFCKPQIIFLKSARIKYIIKSVHLNRIAHAGYFTGRSKAKASGKTGGLLCLLQMKTVTKKWYTTDWATADLRFPQFRSDYGRISASARILRLPRRWCIPHLISALLILTLPTITDIPITEVRKKTSARFSTVG